MTDSTDVAETVKVRFTGTTEGRNTTGIISLKDRENIVLGALEGGDEGNVTLEELGMLQQAGLVLEILESSDDAPAEPEAEIVVPPADTAVVAAPTIRRGSRQTPDHTTEDSASS